MPDLPVQISGPLPVSLPSLCYSLTEKIYETSGKQVWRGYSSVNPELAVILKLFTETEAWRGVREALIYQEIFGRRTCPLTIVPSCLGIYMAPVQGWLMIVLEDVGDPVAEDDVKGLEKYVAIENDNFSLLTKFYSPQDLCRTTQKGRCHPLRLDQI